MRLEWVPKTLVTLKWVSFDLNDSNEGIISSGGMADSLSLSIDNPPLKIRSEEVWMIFNKGNIS